MAREIKFRFWYKGGVYGDQMVRWPEDEIVLENYLKNNGTMMLSTGMLDIDGVEIYEGDVLYRVPQYSKKNGIPGQCISKFNPILVKWYEKRPRGNGTTIGFNIHGETTKYKVAGNIYQNPELIKKHGLTER